MQQYDVDIVIFGGGIAGLWCLNRLRAAGYHAILLETNALGSGQTIHSQGMIHGGVKYALDGVFGNAASAIAAMPPLWNACIEGNGEIDLSATKILSNDYLMWSQGSLLSKTTAFFASKLIRSRIDPIKKAQYPSAFRSPQFKGDVYRRNDLVLESHSLITELAKSHTQWIYKIDQSIQFQTEQIPAEQPLTEQLLTEQNQPHSSPHMPIKNTGISAVRIGNLLIRAKHWLLAAGEGNQNLHNAILGEKISANTIIGAQVNTTEDRLKLPEMQVRPLHQVLVKHSFDHSLFAHCVGLGEKPRLTITSHRCNDGKIVWYLGGALAENGVPLSEAQQISATQNELKQLFPWLDFSSAQYRTVRINRAEPSQQSGNKPDNAFLTTTENISTAWPTKLTLAPDLAQKLIQDLDKINLRPQRELSQIPLPLQQASIATPIWEQLF